MFVKATKFFISSVFGNIDAGQILELSDFKAKQLIDAGLVVSHAQSALPEVKASSFTSPVEAVQPGSLSQVDQASQKKIVSGSEFGEKKVVYRKKGVSR